MTALAIWWFLTVCAAFAWPAPGWVVVSLFALPPAALLAAAAVSR